MVEKQPYYAHKVIVSQLSERFRTMLQAGMTESVNDKTVVTIDGISYEVFSELMKYLYTGKFETLDHCGDKKELMEMSVEFLRVADVEVLDDIKTACEKKLISLCSPGTFDEISEVAEKFNADKLKEFCGWYYRTKMAPELKKQPQEFL